MHSELKAALRAVLRAPRMSAAAIVCVALGAAAVSAIASLLFAALVRPLPFPDADRLVRVWLAEEGGAARGGVAYADVADLRAQVPALARVEAAVRARLIFLDDEGGRRVEGEAVSEGYFDLLGAALGRGRFFTREEHAGAGAPVMLLGHAAWGALFGFADSAVGSTIRTPDRVYTIVGVLAPSFAGTIEDDSGELEFWVPAAPYVGDAREARAGGDTWVLGRLAGQTLARAQAEVGAVGQRIASEHARVRGGTTLRVEPMSENWRAGLRGGVFLLFGAAALLLLVAATNVAGLMLARGVEGQREIAVRIALGAGRLQTIRLLALEAGVLAGVGGLIGLALGPSMLRLFAEYAHVPVPAYIELEAVPAAMASAVVLLGLSAVVAALVPAIVTTRVDPMLVIRTGGRGASAGPRMRRWSSALVVGMVTVTTVLLTGTALLVRSYHALGTADVGFRTDGMLRVALFVNTRDAQETSEVVALQQRALAAVAAQPGVVGVARVWPTVPIVAGAQTVVRYAGIEEAQPERGESVVWYAADPGLFALLEIPLRAGRAFTGSDHAEGEPVVVISESLARRLGGPHAAIDAVIEAVGGERRVIGVVADAAFTGPRSPAYEQVQVFTPIAQTPNRLVSFAIATTSDDPASVLPGVRRALATVAPSSALDWTESYDEAFGAGFETERFILALTGAFSSITLALAALGLFAVLAYSVARTRVEIGVRQALGATSIRVIGGVIGRALTLVLAGLALGLMLAAAMSRALGSLLFGVDGLDPLAYGATALVMIAVAVAASAWPARRAARVQPAVALRGD